MQFLIISTRISRKNIYKRKKKVKKCNDFFIVILLHFYELNYLNTTKSKQKSGMVPEVTLIQNLKFNIVTKFQVPIFKKRTM